MSELTPGLEAALSADRPTIFGAVEINLPGYDLRLLDGAAEVDIGGNIFRGRDPTYGVLASLDQLADGAGDDAGATTIGLLPPSSVAATTLCAAAMQGSRVRAWLGAIDPATGLVVPDPYLLFDGELDVATIKWGKGSREVEYRAVSVFERFFDLEEGIRLSDSHHQSVWPGELGLGFVTGVTEKVPWGVEGTGSVVMAGSGGGGGGGGSGPAWLNGVQNL